VKHVGGKGYLRRWVREHVLSVSAGRTVYVEPFVGGGATFAEVSPAFPVTVAADAHPDLILLWQAVAAGWIPPASLSREEYAALKIAPPSALRGFAGFACSFRGKWFAGQDPPREHPGKRGPDGVRGRPWVDVAERQGCTALRKQAPAFARATILRADYRAFRGSPETVIYADPPYYGTEGYACGAFDHVAFWRNADRWVDEGAIVVVSESVAPAHWPELARTTRNQGLNTSKAPRAEVLFVRGDRR